MTTMSGIGLEAPYSIATLQKPLDGLNGNTHASPVFTFRESRKRKRHEVAIGVDGEGVNIYNVQDQSLVTSYALPPQTYLCCPPCSIYFRPTTQFSAHRRTYLAVKESPESSSAKLICFSEDLGKNTSNDVEFLAPVRKEVKLLGSGVIALDLLPPTANDSATAVVIYADGRVATYSEELRVLEHARNAKIFAKASGRLVEYAVVLSFDDAKRGILKGREDVIALLAQRNSIRTCPALLCRVIALPKGRRLELCPIADTLQSVMDYQLSGGLTTHPADRAQYELHELSGSLYQLHSGKLTVYDLSKTVPKVVTELGTQSNPILSFTRIDSSSILVSTAYEATIYETKYRSVQSSVSIANLASSTSTKKRKREDDESRLAVYEAISAFTKIGLIVGRIGDQLVAMQLREDTRTRNRASSHGTLLSAVIGRGGPKEAHNADHREKKAQRWERWTEKVDSLVNDNDISGLEQLVADESRRGRRQQTSEKINDDVEISNGDETKLEDDDEWALTAKVGPQHLDREKVTFLLSKMFALGSEDQGLQVKIISANLLVWLAMNGLLTAACVRKALRNSAQSDPSISLQRGDITKAIREIDPDFEILHRLISLPIELEVEETVRVLQLTIQSFDSTPTDTAPLALPISTPSQTNGDTVMVTDDADSQLDLESLAAERELTHVVNTLNTGLEVRSDILRMILQRLHAVSPALVTSTMRAMLSQRELVFFVHILRIELADGGWTSKYVDMGEDDEDDVDLVTAGAGAADIRPSDHALRAIGDLLNCAVDAIGTSGWLVGLGSDARGTAELLDNLRAEVSAGLEGCWEAEYLRTYLGEVEKFAGVGDERVRDGWKVSSSAADADAEAALLPLGGGSDSARVGGRSGDRKSKVAVAREKNRRVGKYSFERIRI